MSSGRLAGMAAALVLVTAAGSAQAAPAVVIAMPAAGESVQASVHVQASVTGAAAITSVVADVDGISKPLTSAGAFIGDLDVSALPAGNVTLTVTASDAAGDSTSVTRSLVHVVPGPPPPPPPPTLCATLDGGSPNLTVVNGVAGDTILDYDATRILYVASTGLSIKSRVDGSVTLLTAEQPTKAFLFSAGATWPSGTWNAGTLTTRPATIVFVTSGDHAAGRFPTGKVFRENLVTGVVEQITVSDFDSGPTLDGAGSGTVGYTTISGTSYDLQLWPVGAAAGAKAASSAVDAAILGDELAWHKHWSTTIYPAISYRPSPAAAIEVLDRLRPAAAAAAAAAPRTAASWRMGARRRAVVACPRARPAARRGRRRATATRPAARRAGAPRAEPRACSC